MTMYHWMIVALCVISGACSKSKFKGDQESSPAQPVVETPVITEQPATPNQPIETPTTVTNANQTQQPTVSSNNSNEALGKLAEELIKLTGNGPNNVPGDGGETPLVFDWNRDGKISTMHDGIVNKLLFDVDGDGTLDFIEWVSPNEALLVFDRNENGIIDSGAELFGNATPRRNDRFARTSNGFMALAEYDDNNDGKIDSNDRIYSKLMIWIDANQNGVSESVELKKLTNTDVVSISLNYENLSGADRQLETSKNSTVGQVASYKVKTGEDFKLFDVYFHVSQYGRGNSLTMLNAQGGK